MTKRSIAARTPLGRLFLLWLVGVLVLTMVVVSGLVLDHLETVLVAELEAHARAIARASAAAVGDGRIPAELPEAVLGDVRAIEVRTADGALLWRFGLPPKEVEALAGGLRTLRERVEGSVRAGAGRTGPLEVVVTLDTSRIRRHLAIAAIRMLFGMGVALAASLIVGLAVVAAIVRPLRRLADHAREYGTDRPWPSVDEIGGAAEVVELARSLADMGDRLASQRRALAASEGRWRDLVASSPTPLLELDPGLRVVEANPAARTLLGGEDGSLEERIESPARAEIISRLGALDEGETTGLEARWRLPDGDSAEVELRARRLEDTGERRWLVAVHDQTGRVRRLGEQWRQTFDAMRDGVALVGSDGRVRLANRAFALLGQAAVEHAVDRAAVGREGEWELEHGGKVLACTLSRPEGLDHAILLVRDRTEAASAAARLREAETLQAIGTLASGIAHDFNNLLAGILVHLRLLEREPGAADRAAASIRELAEQGTEVVRELLLLARRETTPHRPVDLAGLVRQQAEVLRRLVSADQRFEVVAPAERVVVEGSPVALRRLLLNLFLNAREAVRTTGGRITVTLERDGDHAVLEVTDEGVGMPDGERLRVREPFWSGRGRGAGLGLAVVDAVVTDHRGRMTVESEPGRGTRIRVTLPLHPGAEPEPPSAGPLDGRRVLVVEPSAVAAADLVAGLVAAGADARHARDAAEAGRLTGDWLPEAVVAGAGASPGDVAASADKAGCPAVAVRGQSAVASGVVSCASAADAPGILAALLGPRDRG